MSAFDQGNETWCGGAARWPTAFYDIGFGDINALIELAAKKPG